MARCLVYFRDGNGDHIVELEVDSDVCADAPDAAGIVLDFDAARAARAQRRREPDAYPTRRRV
jgi:hypothetical protein